MDLIDKEIQQYVEAHTSPEHQLLARLSRETYAKIMMPRMLAGHLQGKVLSMLCQMIKPKNILEIGTYTGYSALSMAEALPQNGKLITIDINEELERMVRRYLSMSEHGSKIDYRVGNAVELIPSLDEVFDLVFIDADKENYSQYYDLLIDKIPKNGFIIADNVLWSGKVLAKNSKKIDVDTQALITFNKKVHDDDRVENVLFPIRDGLMILRKI